MKAEITTNTTGTGTERKLNYELQVSIGDYGQTQEISKQDADLMAHEIKEKLGLRYIGGEHCTVWYFGGVLTFGVASKTAAIEALAITQNVIDGTQEKINNIATQIKNDLREIRLANYSGDLYIRNSNGRFAKLI